MSLDSDVRVGILRLRKMAHCVSHLASLGMTGVVVVLVLSARAGATTYYVSASSGSDANSGTSAAAAWQTVGRVNLQSLQAGDSVLFKRGDVWNDARNGARQDSEIEATKARVMRLEQIAATNTESRIRTEVELGELREGQNEIKSLIQAHDAASKKGNLQK